MKIILSYTLLLFTAIIYLMLTPIHTDYYQIFILDEESISYSHDTGITHDISTLSKQTIFDYQLETYINSYMSGFYIPKGENHYPGIFQRAWSNTFKLDYNTESSINLSAHLFKGSDDFYYLLINYLSNDHTLKSEYLMTINNDILDYQVISNISLLIYKNKSYQTLSDPFVLQSDSTYTYKEATIKNNLLTPTLDGILLLKINETTLEFMELIIDFYEVRQTNPEVTIGLNTFKEVQQRKLIPQSIKLIYKENL